MDEVDDTSIFKTGRPARYRGSLLRLPHSRSGYPRSGLSRSDFVLWPITRQLPEQRNCPPLGADRKWSAPLPNLTRLTHIRHERSEAFAVPLRAFGRRRMLVSTAWHGSDARSRTNETTRVHHAAWRRGSDVANYVARAQRTASGCTVGVLLARTRRLTRSFNAHARKICVNLVTAKGGTSPS